MEVRNFRIAVLALIACFASPSAWAACRDAVVLVHGNAGQPADFANTHAELIARGYAAGEIFRPDWGNKACAACNDHSGSEEAPVLEALVDAVATSCTGRIDVIGHSMGATLAAKQIADHGLAGYVDAFVGIAGAFRGLWSCGTYPYHVATTTCGHWGLSVSSPFLDALHGRRFGARVYSIKSWSDQVVCATGVCTVGGVHSSSIWNENASDTGAYGHFGLLAYTARRQADLIQ
ncbi:alpha/beta fold hydrolase [Vulcaniibacterium tengchongense]|uniref:Lipase (Class 2) n=1 Tax=Vulcaniibacterium tengchongense TaxID=1273429 RepID=A0A3N4VXL3_9GAMM|nr:alpha/beta fold hydrolase [Vulcaniibacterium tengchongense]RPE81867.1 lipase (class 2) [Vulcaniibacterium tengchongense]